MRCVRLGALALLLQGCGSSEEVAPVPALGGGFSGQIPQFVGPDGGVLDSGEGLTLEIPADAVSKTVEITTTRTFNVTVPEGDELTGRVYERRRPAGQGIRRSAWIRLLSLRTRTGGRRRRAPRSQGPRARSLRSRREP